jgi:hypothetical protein
MEFFEPMLSGASDRGTRPNETGWRSFFILYVDGSIEGHQESIHCILTDQMPPRVSFILRSNQ